MPETPTSLGEQILSPRGRTAVILARSAALGGRTADHAADASTATATSATAETPILSTLP